MLYEIDEIKNEDDEKKSGKTIRPEAEQYRKRWHELDRLADPWKSLWREVNEYVLPWSGRFLHSNR